MSERLHIIAACADRKRLPVPPRLRLRTHRATAKKARLQSFIEALESASCVRLPARDLYLGSYWATVRELPEAAAQKGLVTMLWVASAGYGLIPADAPVHAYSATFQLGAPDAVASGALEDPVRVQLSAWWTALSTWRGPAANRPRRLRDLADSDPRASFIVIASPRYVQAMGPDLEAAAEIVGDRLVIVSSIDAAAEPALAEYLVPSEARLLPVVGGSLPSLHARVARDIVLRSRAQGLRVAALQSRYRRLIEGSSYTGMPRREGATDTEVVAFIRRALKRNPSLDCTPALRMWRDGGSACEQKRFKRLFHEASNRHVQ